MKRRRIARRRFAVLGLAIILLFVSAAGCGSSGLRTVPVQGKITLGGGAWPKEGMLYFTPVAPAEGFPNRPGRAPFDIDGNFAAATFVTGDGLYPGKYKIAVECWEIPPSMDAKAPPRRGFAESKFDSPMTSGLEVDVPFSGKTVNLSLDAKPRAAK